MRASNQILTLLMAVTLTACGATASKYRPIVDGPIDAKYESDLTHCGSLSEQKQYTNDDVKSEAAVGAVIGAAIGAIESAEDAVAGAVAGGILGGGERSWEARDERKGIIIECMKLRGHKVVG